MQFTINPATRYHVSCYRDGLLIWEEDFHNLVTTVGKNKLLDACFRTGEAASAWFVGLVNNVSFSAYAAGDTMSSHGGWIEDTDYSDGTRIAYVAAAASSGSQTNSASPSVFNIDASVTIRGAFMVDDSTKGGSSGVLYGVGDFSVARAVISGDQLNVTVTLSC